LKQQLLQQQQQRQYEAYLWEGRRFSWDGEDDSMLYESRKKYDIDLMREEYESRLFEDPLYLMQYTITWEDTSVGGTMQQSPENEAFINAENEFYLKRVC